MGAVLRFLGRLAFPAAILAGAFAFIFFSDELPPALDMFKRYGPYIVFAAGASLAAAFHRGRALFALLTLVAAYAAQQWWLQGGLTTADARAVYLALTVFVPVNLALYALWPERGILNWHGAARLALIAVQVGLIAWLIAYGRTDITDWAAGKFLVPAPFGIGAIPQAGIAAVLLGLVVSLAAAFVTRSAVSASCAGAVVAFAIAAHVPTASLTFSVFVSAAELMVAVAILHDRFGATGPDRSRGKPRNTGGRRAA